MTTPHSIPPELQEGAWLPVEELRPWLGACGEGVRVYRGCRLLPPTLIRIGDYSQIDEGVWVFAGQGVEIGRHVHLAVGSTITGGGYCVIRDYAGIGAGVRLVTGTEVIDQGGLTNPTVPAAYRQVRRGRVEVGSHAVIFTNTVVLPDVVIGEGAVVAAGSVVHRNLKPWGIYGGNPLVQIGVRPADPILAQARALEQSRTSEI